MSFPVPAFGSRRVWLALLFAPAALFPDTLVQKNPPVRSSDADSPVLIWDVDPKQAKSLPRDFRTTNDPIKAAKGQIPSGIGLADLHASGSGEFTADGLKLLLARTRGPVTVFDLRQETHIFVNGLPVSWFATNDWANVGRTQSAIVADENARVESLKPGSKLVVRPGAAVKKPGITPSTTENVTVEHASTEPELVEASHAASVRVTVTDHCRPLDNEVDRFIVAVRALPDNGWAHFHCEAGRGRTTTFMVLYDMLRNAARVPIEDIVRRQQLLGYDYDVLRPAGPGDWRAPYTEDRIAFVRAFYDYARANPNGRPQLWSEWLKSGAQ
jgi:protein-tyrosine phosphatase